MVPSERFCTTHAGWSLNIPRQTSCGCMMLVTLASSQTTQTMPRTWHKLNRKFLSNDIPKALGSSIALRLASESSLATHLSLFAPISSSCVPSPAQTVPSAECSMQLSCRWHKRRTAYLPDCTTGSDAALPTSLTIAALELRLDRERNPVEYLILWSLSHA